MVKIRKNDEVIVLSGKHKGQKGHVLEIDRKNNKIKIDKINIVKKHVKPSQQNPDGEIKEFEAFIDISNVALSIKSKKNNEATKVKIEIDKKGIKKRVSKKTGKEV